MSLLYETRLEWWQYRFTLAYLAAQFLVLAVSRPRCAKHVRPGADATWFISVYIWGIESLHHGYWWVFDAPYMGFAKPFQTLLPRAVLSLSVLGLAISASLASEWFATRKGLPARASAGALPLPVVAAIVGVHWTWSLWCLVFLPLR